MYIKEWKTLGERGLGSCEPLVSYHQQADLCNMK